MDDRYVNKVREKEHWDKAKEDICRHCNKLLVENSNLEYPKSPIVSTYFNWCNSCNKPSIGNCRVFYHSIIHLCRDCFELYSQTEKPKEIKLVEQFIIVKGIKKSIGWVKI